MSASVVEGAAVTDDAEVEAMCSADRARFGLGSSSAPQTEYSSLSTGVNRLRAAGASAFFSMMNRGNLFASEGLLEKRVRALSNKSLEKNNAMMLDVRKKVVDSLGGGTVRADLLELESREVGFLVLDLRTFIVQSMGRLQVLRQGSAQGKPSSTENTEAIQVQVQVIRPRSAEIRIWRRRPEMQSFAMSSRNVCL